VRPEIEDFQRRYVERARAEAGRPFDAVLLGREHDAPVGDGRYLAGWWCRHGADERVAVLPNPWDDRSAVASYDEYAWDLTREQLALLASALDELHGVERPLVYWDLLLVFWLHSLVTALLDRCLFLDTVSAIAPKVRILAPPAQLTTPLTISDGFEQQLTDDWNVAFMRALAAREVDDVARRRDGVMPPATRLTLSRLVRGADLIPRLAAAAYAQRRLGRFEGRTVALMGMTGVSPGQLLALAREVSGVRTAPRAGDTPWPPTVRPPHPDRDRLAVSTPGAERLAPLLPLLVPQSAVEAHSDLKRVSLERCGPPSHILHRNYGWNDVENDFLGRSTVAGKAVAYGQHGGATLQLAVAPMERHMNREGRVYLSWGATSGPNVKAVADPHLDPLRDTHKGGDSILLVESLTPPYTWVYRFTSTPLGNQNLADELRLVRFVEAVGPAREHLMLKGFPGPAAAAARHPVLNALPLAERLRSRPAPFWMRNARVVVCPYPDTPFIEAMVIGAPTLGLWDTTLWGMRPDAAPHIAELERLGIVHSDPETAAAKLDEIYDSADAWWSSPEIAAARRAFIQRFAIPGDWKRDWAAVLHELID
jgi:hypothetical protein